MVARTCFIYIYIYIIDSHLYIINIIKAVIIGQGQDPLFIGLVPKVQALYLRSASKTAGKVLMYSAIGLPDVLIIIIMYI